MINPLPHVVKGVTDRLNHLSVFSRVASITLTIVLVTSTVFNIGAARLTRAALAAANTAYALDATFATARYAVGAEESLERKYRLEPGYGVFTAHRASAAALSAAMRKIVVLGDATDRAAAQDVLDAHRSYLSGTAKMFAAVDRGDTANVIAIDHNVIDPVFGHIERVVDERSKAHFLFARGTLEALDGTQRSLIAITIALSALGVLGLGVFLAVLLAYQLRLRVSHKAELRRLEEAALIDNLTGIGNHRAYQEDLNREVSRAQRYGETLSLVVMDVDDFKVVNDRNGHMHGDDVLKALAALLQTLRTEDRPYRLGGDEFAVILPHTSTVEAVETMQRMSATVQTEVFGVTVSVGIATLTGLECDRETLQSQADAAMYSGKRAGRNGVAVFDASKGGMWLLSPKKIHALRELIADGEMQIAFQPIWDVEAGCALAYEALARPDPKYGFEGPQEAFDLAERIGRAHDLDALCRNSALAAARNRLPEGALLFINVSPQSLDHGRLAPLEFAAAVRAVGLTPERIVIEITERSISRVDKVIHAAQELQRHGFRLALDDTGAGNSGLEIMSRLTLEYVKIDREVIVQALDHKNARGVLAGIIAIAASTDAYVIAEGIETTEMLNFVCHIGERAAPKRAIRGVQGYLLRRPSPTFANREEMEDISALLREFSVNFARVPRA